MADSISHSLDDHFQTTALGSINRAIGNNLYGVNHQQTGGMVPLNKDIQGLTFFVRPQLNLNAVNIRNFRIFYPLLSKNQDSIQRFVRCTLDPRLSVYKHPIPCPLVDPLQAFIPVFTNDLVSLSGWPDIAVNTFTSKQGIAREVYSQIDDIAVNYEPGTIDATFRNTRGDPIMYLFYIWVHYASAVFRGILAPYPDFIRNNMLDYCTRIYRLVLDASKTYVRKIAATGVSFPVNVPMGKYFDFNSERPYNDQTSELTIRFQSLGFQYQDDILVKEFNTTVGIFNPAMKMGYNKNNGQLQMNPNMRKINKNIAHLFNNRGYPRINGDTYELEWYISQDELIKRLDRLLGAGLINQDQYNVANTGT